MMEVQQNTPHEQFVSGSSQLTMSAFDPLRTLWQSHEDYVIPCGE
jgi:hypothetical protein